MSRKLLFVFGNGFTMDFLHYVGCNDKVDVRNLFRFGSCVKWPSDNIPGFLSFKHCPHLWNLGARPQMSEHDTMLLIEDIITCVNVHATSFQKPIVPSAASPNDIYLYAYKELAIYLKHLFVAYDKAVPVSGPTVANWPWLDILRNANSDPSIDEIDIITYNYDIWLERILKDAKVPFCIAAIQPPNPGSKINIFKPHGSINFAHKHTRDPSAFEIVYSRDWPDAPAKDFSITYDNLDKYYLVNPMIPPAGDSGRFNQTWAKEIRSLLLQKVKEFKSEDEVVICGLSYWHVDRAELDELLVSLPQQINIKMVNPNPNRSLNTVIASLFANFISYSSASELKGAGL